MLRDVPEVCIFKPWTQFTASAQKSTSMIFSRPRKWDCLKDSVGKLEVKIDQHRKRFDNVKSTTGDPLSSSLP